MQLPSSVSKTDTSRKGFVELPGKGIPGKTNEAWMLFCMTIPCSISQNRQMTPKFSEMNSSIVEDTQRGSQILQDRFSVVQFGENFVVTETHPRQPDFVDTESQHACPELVCLLHACQLQAMHFSEKLWFWASRKVFYKGKGGLSYGKFLLTTVAASQLLLRCIRSNSRFLQFFLAPFERLCRTL